MATVDLTLPLSEILHDGTLHSHKEVENSAGAKTLVQGELSRDEYARFLMILWHVYDAFEEALERHANHPVLQPTYNPTLFSRREAIAADISYILQVPESSWRSHPIYVNLTSPFPSGLNDYTSRIRSLDSSSPSLLLAHSYVRYLGDLSGGQFIRHRLAKAYGLDEASGSGLSFYSFKQFGDSHTAASQGDMRKIKKWFKAGMDAGVGNNTELKAAILEEANLAFDLNKGLFTSLDIKSPSTELQKEIQVAVKPEKTYPLASVIPVIMAVCLAHFIIVVGGLTGDRGFTKLLNLQQWFSSVWTE